MTILKVRCCSAKPLMLFIAIVACASARASDGAADRESLRGLTGVYVLVEKLPDRLQTLVTDDQIQTDVELRLRKTGIRVLSEEEWLQASGHPTLYVNVNAVSVEGKYSYSVNADLTQDVMLVRNKATARGNTWSTDGVGQVAEGNLRSRVREVLGDTIDRFANAYLSVNPMPGLH